MQKPIIVKITNEPLVLVERINPKRFHKWYAISFINIINENDANMLSEIYVFPPNTRPLQCIYAASGELATQSDLYGTHILLGVGPADGLEGIPVNNNQITWRVVTPSCGWDNTTGIRSHVGYGIDYFSGGAGTPLSGARGVFLYQFIFPVLAKTETEAYYLRFLRGSLSSSNRHSHATLLIEEVI